MQALRSASELGVKVAVKAKGIDYLRMVQEPPHGYGKNMNPCIDCRIFMLRKTVEFMKEVDASFVFTGEVIGQRPMSQRRDAISLIERESGLAGLILRPLSARLFPPTIPETEGVVDREKLLDLSGRSRKGQYRLAREYDLKEFGCPAGGCLSRLRRGRRRAGTPSLRALLPRRSSGAGRPHARAGRRTHAVGLLPRA